MQKKKETISAMISTDHCVRTGNNIWKKKGENNLAFTFNISKNKKKIFILSATYCKI